VGRWGQWRVRLAKEGKRDGEREKKGRAAEGRTERELRKDNQGRGEREKKDKSDGGKK
jgi:hypothetical protein